MVERLDLGIALHSATIITQEVAEQMVSSVQRVVDRQNLGVSVTVSFVALDQFVSETA